MSITYPQVTNLGTILSIWAHPDDESWCAAGILAAAVANGQTVACVTATRGEEGVQDESKWPHAQLGKIREHELAESLKVLGIKQHQLLDYTDGHCHETDDQEAAAKLVPIIEKVRPDTVLTFGPDGLTGHTDHQAVSRWTSLALTQAKLSKPARLLHKAESQEWYNLIGKTLDERNNLYFAIEKPRLYPQAEISFSFYLPAELAERKLDALRAQHSQMDSFFNKMSSKELADFASYEGFVSSLYPPQPS